MNSNIKRGEFELEFNDNKKYLWQYERDFEDPSMVSHIIRPLFESSKNYWSFQSPLLFDKSILFDLDFNHRICITNTELNDNKKMSIDIELIQKEPQMRIITNKIKIDNIDDIQIYRSHKDEIDKHFQKIKNFIDSNKTLCDELFFVKRNHNDL